MKAGSQLKKGIGTLYIVPTPIGNLEDMTFRAVRVLQSVDCILAEDTRQTAILCRRYEILTRRVSFNEHNGQGKIPWILEQMNAGMAFALVSDAGCPGISDPGEPLIGQVVAAGLPLEVLPGPSSVTTALVGSAFSTNRFLFEGFLPRKGKGRNVILQSLRSEERTIVLFESPPRLSATLDDLAQAIAPHRLAVVARELTKIHESWHRGTLAELARLFAATPPRGEMVIVIEGATELVTPPDDAMVEQWIATALNEGMGVKEVARMVAGRTSLSSSVVYRMILDRKT
ncbi:MAG: 16S rRNA (cytidine(1402)-2'-O)-methyltransferase [Magnetococcales bacterium]|nr:16S rRNA (cytidine(1402)-2'-O)-methyltransferase [Magnetococcales bacterium]MBF0151720.1 16S rRNA (cytidine(1402)-2'-O)-methyltransferase [Magnetococcales bacterium]MBF0171901.1 16S rRNA (cytidine(1402)-2'-O)-methyltransferase [Magnetococcales bacterium]MBF0347201.1 16S rRNA (cytidine(1402)-2'-O)-methyltransferase [Magnetococcales bacterium]MBF0630475.1 16S rRNA (cytidine(1402)-2'-O)-methyltransferase [Magnetococcales bacterium]